MACSNTRYLKGSEKLYTGSTLTITDKAASKSDRSALKSELSNAIRPKPNRTLLGMRVRLLAYNLAGEPKRSKGIRYNIRNKFGEPPVLDSDFGLDHNRQVLQNILENKGFFYPVVKGDTTVKGKKMSAHFDVQTGRQYHIREVTFITDTTQLSKNVAATSDKTLLKKGVAYNLDLIKAERERIDKVLKEQGYYYFQPEYLFAQADSTVGDYEVDLYVRIKNNETPEQAYEQFSIRNVYIYPGYSIDRYRSDTSKTKAEKFGGFYIVDPRHRYKPVVFTQSMQFAPGDLYNLTDHNLALNRLINIGTFKFVKNRFEQIGRNQMDAYYYLTPYPRKSLRLEIGANTKNDSRVGSQVTVSWRHRNAFRGAELLTLKVNGGFEMQYGAKQTSQPNIYQLSAEVGVAVPRFIVPFFKIKASSLFPPKTVFSTGYEFQLKQGLYDIQSFKIGIGYVWKEEIRKEHKFNPININYVRTNQINKDTTIIINYNTLVFNGLIIGPSYEYTFNSNVTNPNRPNFYFNGLADLSGNILGLIMGTRITDTPFVPKQVLGTDFAQYVKAQLDFRYFYPLSKKLNWANHLILGLGVPYGNSYRLPNVKQYFSGGNSSLRGFRSRTVGPGTFNTEELMEAGQYVEVLADLKLEMSTELRWKVYRFFQLGVFADAGNVWNYRDESSYPGGKFNADFYKQLAVDAGIGIRLDFSILLLRGDFAIPIRKPWLAEGDRWVFNQIALGDPHWRSQNIIFNLAIGYPF
jgi:outer membrane protein assembly factor BamA